jgi:SAM-dependent methyltransferase
MADTVRFAFGENWQSYADTLDPGKIDEAVESLRDFFPDDRIRGARFLDIGCGSGLFSLAAIKLGAREVVAVDYDPNSVAAATSVLERHAPAGAWQCMRDDVLSMTPERHGDFDIVYSWGVLHHTGDMYRAIASAAKFVKPGGQFLIALYGKTRFCGFWHWEKRWYSRFKPWFPVLAKCIYKPLILLRLLLGGQNPKRYIETYRTRRGMNWHHDVEDWLGGYPYESITPEDATSFVTARGFECRRSVTESRIGVFGTGCDEYLFQRNLAAADSTADV